MAYIHDLRRTYEVLMTIFTKEPTKIEYPSFKEINEALDQLLHIYQGHTIFEEFVDILCNLEWSKGLSWRAR